MSFKASYFWWFVAPLLKVEALVSIVLYSHYFMQEIKLSQNLDPEFTAILATPRKREKLQETFYFMGKSMVSCRFSLKPILWISHLHISLAEDYTQLPFKSPVAQ